MASRYGAQRRIQGDHEIRVCREESGRVPLLRKNITPPGYGGRKKKG